MKRINLKRKTLRQFNYTTGRKRTYLHTMWKGTPSIALCVASFNRWFELPKGCDDIDLVFTKTPHPEAYDIQIDIGIPGWPRVMINNQHTGMMSGAQFKVRRLWEQGYNYVRVEVNS